MEFKAEVVSLTFSLLLGSNKTLKRHVMKYRGIYFSKSFDFFPIYLTTSLNFFPISSILAELFPYPKSREFARIYTPDEIARGREKTRSHFSPTPFMLYRVEKKTRSSDEIPLFPYPYMLYRGREKEDLAFFVPLGITYICLPLGITYI